MSDNLTTMWSFNVALKNFFLYDAHLILIVHSFIHFGDKNMAPEVLFYFNFKLIFEG